MNLVNVKREDIVNKLALGWLLRRKAWCSSLYIKAEDPFKLKKDDWAADDWEGYLPIPILVKRKHKYYLEYAISHAKQNLNSYFRDETWSEGKFIKWDFDKLRFVHVFNYPKIDEDAHVSFSGDTFNEARFEIWLAE